MPPEQEILALIPARGGSKGIPRKNILKLAGKPLIAHTIEQAQHTASITQVVVSTDDDEIARVSELHGARVIWRPAEISGDTASSESALIHALNYLRAFDHFEPDLVVFLQATSPLRRECDIQNAIDQLRRENADSLLSVTPFNGFLWRSTETGSVSFSYDFRHRPRRQDAPRDFVENGSIYVFKPAILFQYDNRLGGKISMYEMSPLDSIQIDEPDDLLLVEALMPRSSGSPTHSVLEQIRLLALDFDGVLTDNRVLVHQGGDEAVFANRADGWGLTQLMHAGLHVFVISAERNPVVAARCRKLGVRFEQAVEDKFGVLMRLVDDIALTPSQVAYIGNDVNDLECLRWVGLPIAVADSTPEVLSAALWRTTKRGGEGAVREVADLLLQSLRR